MIEQIDDTTFDITTVSGHISAVEVGDLLQDDFYPQLKVKAWDNESNFSVRLDTSISGSDFELNDDGSVSWYSPYGDVIGTFYYYTSEEIENGGYEFELDLYDKPSSRTIPFTIRSKELDFFYQPPLTQEEIDDGNERPENVVGSYAVYHSSKSNNEYKTGKAFHIFRPWAQDKNGWKVWCELNIDVVNQTLTITLPEDFYNDAVYPVKVDPNYGYTTVGTSTSASSANRAYFAKATVGTGTTNNIYAFYVRGYKASANVNTKSAVWAVSGSTLVDRSTNVVRAISSTSSSWYSQSPTTRPQPVLSASTAYYFGFVVEATGATFLYDAGSAGDGGYSSNNYSTPTNLGSISNSTYKFSTYCQVSNSSVQQRVFRFRNDNGSETTATWKAAENTNISIDLATSFRLRILLYEQNVNAVSYVSPNIEYRKNSGSWVKAGVGSASGTDIYISLSSNITSNGGSSNAPVTTTQLTPPSGKTFSAGYLIDDVNEATGINYNNMGFNKDRYTEFEYSLSSQAPGANNDIYDIRMTGDTQPFGTYTVTPRITIIAAASGYTHSVNGVAAASIASINGIPKANIAKVNGV
jgi:hypothetical protein